MKKTRELALKAIAEARAWLTEGNDDRTLNYLRLAKEQVAVDEVVEEAQSLGINVYYMALGMKQTVPISVLRKQIAKKKAAL